MARKKKTTPTPKSTSGTSSGRMRNTVAAVDVDFHAVFAYSKVLLGDPEVVSLVPSRDDLLADLRLGFEHAHPGFTLACVPAAPDASNAVNRNAPAGQSSGV